MNTNLDIPLPETNDSALGITAELLPGTEVDVVAEEAFRKHWQETGECREPQAIGTLSLDKTTKEVLARDLSSVSIGTEYPELFSADDDLAARAARAEETDIVPEASRNIIRGIWSSFSKLIEEDLSKGAGTDGLFITGQQFFVGRENGIDNMHIDVQDGPLRYLVTVVGPTTEFYLGNINHDDFDESGDYTGSATPESVQLPEGTLTRFTTFADPHKGPSDSEGTFRLIMIATVGTEFPHFGE